MSYYFVTPYLIGDQEGLVYIQDSSDYVVECFYSNGFDLTEAEDMGVFPNTAGVAYPDIRLNISGNCVCRDGYVLLRGVGSNIVYKGKRYPVFEVAGSTVCKIYFEYIDKVGDYRLVRMVSYENGLVEGRSVLIYGSCVFKNDEFLGVYVNNSEYKMMSTELSLKDGVLLSKLLIFDENIKKIKPQVWGHPCL